MLMFHAFFLGGQFTFGTVSAIFCYMIKNLTKKEFLSDLSPEELDEIAKNIPSDFFEEKQEYIGKTKEFIIDMHKEAIGEIYQDKNPLYSYLDLQIEKSHLLCVLCMDVCVRACLINDMDVSIMATLFRCSCLRPGKKILEEN